MASIAIHLLAEAGAVTTMPLPSCCPHRKFATHQEDSASCSSRPPPSRLTHPYHPSSPSASHSFPNSQSLALTLSSSAAAPRRCMLPAAAASGGSRSGSRRIWSSPEAPARSSSGCEDRLAALKDKDKEQGAENATPELNTEVLFLCSYEGCGKTFFDAGALRKHAHVHGERQYICHYDNCGKKFLDSSKLKRHFLIHTGEKNFVCPHEGCGKAFSLDFNLKAHMKTHSADNYHVCQYPDCGRRFTQESKLRAHIRSQHEKVVSLQNPGVSAVNHNALGDYHQTPKPVKASATPPAPSAERPYVCPYDGCDKAYIHEYKLNLHLKKEHPSHYQDGGPQGAAPSSKRSISKSSRRSKPDITARMPQPKILKRKGGYAAPLPAVTAPEEHQWLRKATYEDDSEETEEEGDNNIGDGWRYSKTASSDDEETEDEE